MQGRVAVIDGVVMPVEEATVSVLDRGFLYGDSVFETIRTYGGKPFALGEHLARLARSASLVHIDLPVALEQVAREVQEGVHAAGNPESYVRVMVTRGSGELGLDPALASRGLRVVLVAPLVGPTAQMVNEGVSAITFATRRVSDDTGAAGAKVGNYLVSVLAIRAAKAKGAHEALIVDGEGRIVEGATSNVFFVRGGRLVTPSVESGILPGITRELLLEVAREMGIDVVFEAPRASDVPEVEELMISSSIREILPVVRLDDARIGDGTPGAFCRALREAFDKKVALLSGRLP